MSPAYRGVAYVRFAIVDLSEHGLTVPQYTWRIYPTFAARVAGARRRKKALKRTAKGLHPINWPKKSEE